jgi:hypothetical protein
MATHGKAPGKCSPTKWTAPHDSGKKHGVGPTAGPARPGEGRREEERRGEGTEKWRPSQKTESASSRTRTSSPTLVSSRHVERTRRRATRSAPRVEVPPSNPVRLSALMDLYIHPLYVLVIKILSSILNSPATIHPLSTVGPTCHFI